MGEPHGVLRVSAPVALGRQQIVPRLRRLPARLPAGARGAGAVGPAGGDDAGGLRRRAAPHGRAARHPRRLAAVHHAQLARGLARVPAPRGRARERRRISRRTTACTTCAPATRRPGASSRTAARDPASRRHGARVSVGVRGVFAANNSEALRDAARPAWASRCCPTSARRRGCSPASCSWCCRSGSGRRVRRAPLRDPALQPGGAARGAGVHRLLAHGAGGRFPIARAARGARSLKRQSSPWNAASSGPDEGRRRPRRVAHRTLHQLVDAQQRPRISPCAPGCRCRSGGKSPAANRVQVGAQVVRAGPAVARQRMHDHVSGRIRYPPARWLIWKSGA